MVGCPGVSAWLLSLARMIDKVEGWVLWAKAAGVWVMCWGCGFEYVPQLRHPPHR